MFCDMFTCDMEMKFQFSAKMKPEKDVNEIQLEIATHIVHHHTGTDVNITIFNLYLVNKHIYHKNKSLILVEK